jgi:hypothetical protein
MPRIIDENGTREVSQEVYDTYMASLSQTWNKSAHIAEINQYHEEVFQDTIANLLYIDKWEVVSAASDINNLYYNEAFKLMEYWWKGWEDIKTYSETVTEENQIKPEYFVKTLIDKYL